MKYLRIPGNVHRRSFTSSYSQFYNADVLQSRTGTMMVAEANRVGTEDDGLETKNDRVALNRKPAICRTYLFIVVANYYSMDLGF